jgi:hypothetical protein
MGAKGSSTRTNFPAFTAPAATGSGTCARPSGRNSSTITGMTEAEARHYERVAAIAGHGWFQRMLDEQMRRHEKVDESVVRELYRVLAVTR